MQIKIFFLSILFICGAHSAFASGVKDLTQFKHIPVIENGRVKPLDTFARSVLTQFSGKDHYQKEEGIAWLADVLFLEEKTMSDRVFLINNPDIAAALEIPVDSHRRYTPAQLKGSYRKLAELQSQARNISEKERSLVEREILRIFDNINIYADLSRSYANMHLVVDQTEEMTAYWRAMSASYRLGNQADFDAAVVGYINVVGGKLSKSEQANVRKFPLELLYHKSSPFTWAIVFYILAFLLFVASLASSKKLGYVLGLGAVICGFIPHALGLIARTIIMDRPPVTNLYETFVFVGLMGVILGLFIERNNRQWLGVITAAICGAVMLFIANRYSADGDTLTMMVAVLDSNFWLATHVTTITMGYGATCVAGVLGHVWLIQAALGKPQAMLDKTYKTTMGILGFSLTLTFLGTNLGGVWADQSWGRFWGWDPKENGALMIVLWIAIILHARVAKMIDALGVAVGCVIGLLIVMWAWFGVNLLSVGLHSYGFTSGVATTLIIYAIVELLFLVFTVGMINQKTRSV